MRKTNVAAGLVGILSATALAARAEDTVTLKRVFTPGQTRYVELSRDIKRRDVTAPNTPERSPIQSQQTYGVFEKVESVKDGNAKISLSYDRVHHSIVSAPALAYDTDVGSTTEMARLYDPVLGGVLGKSFGLTMDYAGNVLSFSGLTQIMSDIENYGGKASAALAREYRGIFNDDSGRQMWGVATGMLYRGTPVKVGQTWERSTSSNLPEIGEVITEYKITLDRVETQGGRRVAVVTYKTALKPGAPASRPVGQPYREFGSGAGSGSAVYDIEAGHYVRQEETVRWTVFRVLSDPRAPQTKRVPTELTRHDVRRVLTPEQRKTEREAHRAAASAPATRAASQPAKK